MRIGYLVPEFPGQTHGFFWREIKHIEAQGHEVTIFSTRHPRDRTTHAFSKAAKERTHYLGEFRIRDIPRWVSAAILSLPLFMREDVRNLRSKRESFFKILALSIIGSRLASLCRLANIEHIHGHSCADAAYVLALSKLSGGPSYSLSLHGDLDVYGRGHDFKFGHAKFVACVTEALCEQVRARVSPLAMPPQLIRMGIERFQGDTRKTRRSPANSLRIVTVARLNPMKGHRHAIAAVKSLIERGIDVSYDIIGEGDYFENISELIHTLQLDANISMVGPVSNEQVVDKLSEYDVFILPSIGLGEAAPVAVMEAMGAGVLVVCSVIGGTPEMIHHEQTGYLFPQGDEFALTRILEDLARDLVTRERVARSGKTYAETHFLTSLSAAKLTSCIAL